MRMIFHRLWHWIRRHGAVGYCTVCRKPIYETFSQHWDRVRHYE